MDSVQRFIEDGIRTTSASFKARSPGTQSEYACQQFFAKRLLAWADHVSVEDFSLHPRAFLGWISLCVTAELLAIAMLMESVRRMDATAAGFALSLSLFAALCMWFEFFRYRQFVDILFPKKVSHNVYAVRESQNPPKRRIVFCAHADAAFEFRYIYLFGGRLAMPLVLFGVTGAALLLALSAGMLTLQALDPQQMRLGLMLACIALGFAPIFLALFFFTNRHRVTDGANDNLSGCYAAFSVMRYLAQNKIRLCDTEVCCLITGAEEAGLRGAEAFAKRHSAEFYETQTIVIALDTLREREKLMVYTNGMYGFQRSSKAVGKLLQKAAGELGIKLPEAPPYPGAMDSDAFSRQGILACGLGAVDHEPKPYYHTRKDTADNIDAQVIELCAQICIRAAELYDKNGLVL